MVDPLAGFRWRLHFVDHAFNTPDWRWDSRVNRWPGLLLWLVVNGQGTIAIRGQATYRIGPGDCFLFDMRHPHQGRNDSDQPLEVRAAGFVAEDSLGQEQRILWPGQRFHRRLSTAVAVGAGLDRLLTAHRAGDHAATDALLRDLLDAVRAVDLAPLPSGPERVRQERLTAIADEVLAEPARPWTASALARRAGLGREHFSRAFARHTGLTPARFILQVRLDRARALLRGTTAGVAEVGQAVGFADPAYFSRQFAKVVGCSPLAYRRQLAGWDTGNVVLRP